MSNLVWLAISVVTALVVTAISILFALAVTRPAAQVAVSGNASLPTAPLQRLAIAAFFSSLVLAATGAMIALLEGPDAYQTRDGVRLLVSMLALASTIAATVPVWIARRRSRQGHIVLDERDELILFRAPGYQAISMLVVDDRADRGFLEQRACAHRFHRALVLVDSRRLGDLAPGGHPVWLSLAVNPWPRTA